MSNKKKFKFTDPSLPDLGHSIFAQRITKLLEQAKRLAMKEAKGFRYKKIWVKKCTVKRHERVGHWTLRPVKK